jgi:hypothetical protein
MNIDLPEAGKGVTLAFNLSAMETLSDEYGEQYVNDVIRRISLFDPKCLRLCVETMASEEIELADLLKKIPVSELALRINDAIALALTGKLFGEPAE